MFREMDQQVGNVYLFAKPHLDPSPHPTPPVHNLLVLSSRLLKLSAAEVNALWLESDPKPRGSPKAQLRRLQFNAIQTLHDTVAPYRHTRQTLCIICNATVFVEGDHLH